jgi:dipeptidase D
MTYLLQGLEPEPVWRIFEEISRIPRCSKHEEKLQKYLLEWATMHNLSYKKDEVGNILMMRKAAPGYSACPVLMFQAHQDMVCEKTPESSHNFDTDPIPLKIETNKIRSHNTSLGADNGLGMALAMAVLLDKTLKSNCKLEALFTVDEEAGFTGVRNLKPDFFTAKHMINLDSEEVGVIIVSSAGGGGTTYKIDYRPQTPDSREAIRVSVDGLQGGHSGVDIHLPRYNANKLLAEGLLTLHSELTIRLIHFEGGTRSNAIPRNAFADILVSSRRTERAMEIIEDWKEHIDKTSERDLLVSVNQIEPRPAAPIHETEQTLNIIAEIPFGPKSWSPEYPHLVQTSNNNGIVRTEDNAFIIQVSSRTSDIKDGYDNQRILYELGQKHRVKTDQRDVSSGWRADNKSKLLHLVEKSYREALGRKPKVTGIHGGLECGVIAKLKKDMDIVSVGPTIKYPHSPSEYAAIKGVDILFRTLLAIASEMHKL